MKSPGRKAISDDCGGWPCPIPDERSQETRELQWGERREARRLYSVMIRALAKLNSLPPHAKRLREYAEMMYRAAEIEFREGVKFLTERA